VKETYLPIPVGIPYVKDTKTSSTIVSNWCGSSPLNLTTTAVAELEVKPSSSTREYEPIVVRKSKSGSNGGSWSQIRKSGVIRMTPYSVTNERTINLLASVERDVNVQKLATNGEPSLRTSGGQCIPCGQAVKVVALASVEGTYLEQGDPSYWGERFSGAAHYHSGSEFDRSKLEKLKSEAFAELFQGYNLGEELYEMRDTIRTMTSLLNRGALWIRDSKRAFDRAKRLGGMPAAAKAWMEFRYGIMPIIYSIQDLQKTLSNTGQYITVRRRLSPDFKEMPPRPDDTTHFYSVSSDQSSITITCKGKWASAHQANLDRININLLTTAAAVYPWAMVVRWFFNSNSWLDAQLKSSTTSAQQYVGCVAERTVRETDTFLHLVHDSRTVVSALGNSSCGPGWYGPTGPYEKGQVSSFDLHLKRETINNYVRTLYSPKDTKLVWSPYLSWQRIVDGLIMGTGQVSKLLRSI